MKKFFKGIVYRISFACSVCQAGFGLSDKAYLFYKAIQLQALAQFDLTAKPFTCRVQTGFNVTTLYLTGTLEDLQILEDIFVNEEYESEAVPNRILDLGGNIGLSATWFALRYPNAQIWVYEPGPDAFQVLIKNISSFPKITAICAAVGDKDGTLPFYVDPKRSIASSLYPNGKSIRRIEVPCITLEQAVAAHGPIDLLKIDTEGAEYATLSAYTGRFPVIVGEFDTRGGHTGEEMVQLLSVYRVHPTILKNKQVFIACQ